MAVDICVNLLNRQFRRDRIQVLRRARSEGVDVIVTATDLASSAAAGLWWATHRLPHTAGIHPHDISTAAPNWTQQLFDLAQLAGVVAVGETGLDFNRNYSPKNEQIEGFRKQIEIACELSKPLFVHDRESAGAVLEVLNRAAGRYRLPPVVIHCFTGSAWELDAYLEAGFYIGITGWIADRRRGSELRELVARIPLERLLVETDAPFLMPQNLPQHHGAPARHKRRNEPAYLPHVIASVAAARDECAAHISASTDANARRLFGITPASALS